jgi:hypothetical protein
MLEQLLVVVNYMFEKVNTKFLIRIFSLNFIQLEMSDERTLREDLIIREGSSPEGKKGILYH